VIKYPKKQLVDPEQEKILWTKLNKNPEDDNTFTKLVELYLPIVNRIVKQIAYKVHWRIEPRELVGSGVIGLQKAISRYTIERGIPFEKYASPRIRGEILDELRARDPLTRSQRQSVRKVYQAVNEFITQNERPPTELEIAKQTQMNTEDVAMAFALGTDPINLNAEYENGLHYIDIIPDNTTKNPEQLAHHNLAIEELKKGIKKLDKRDQQLLYFRHQEQLNVKEVAHLLNISPGRVSQLYNAIVLKLRTILKVELIT